MPDYSKGILVLTPNEINNTVNKSLSRLRQLGEVLLKSSTLNYLAGIAVIGECEVPAAHIIYYYHENDYMLAIRTAKENAYTTKLIAEHTDEQRQYTISLWLPELLCK